MEKYICIHGHFYQPPRENPWLETIELQESAYPYHDWNERITAECYQPNTAARIFDPSSRISQILNNYSKISFNFGPTLMAWLQECEPQVYAAIIEADRAGQRNFSGHGSAIAQAYNHMILPLANHRDRYTQVVWGIRDFEKRFGRKPEGMWLPETAVDLETLDILAELGIQFTILSPYQAKRVRPLNYNSEPQPGANGNTPRDENEGWQVVEGGHIDPTRAYLQKLPSGRTINLFFYDGPISQGIAFGDTLNRGENFANRLSSAFSDQRDWPQLVHIATDGETYGHHHKFGDMALAYALNYIESQNIAKITNYGEYLEKYPPMYEVEILENTAWSCPHGVGRWMTNCGCNSGGHAGWNQEWRAPLRAALDWLRDELAPRYEARAREVLKDPWAARDDYIDVILDRRRENRDEFFAQHATHALNDEEAITALKLLELQRHALLMYTSCGWFFDELSGIETVQVIQYAARALQLANDLFDQSLEPEFLNRLAQAKSNIPENGDGRTVFEKFVRPAEVDLRRVAAHYAVSSLFEDYPDESRIFAFTVVCGDFRRMAAGPLRLALSHSNFISEITRESADLTFGVLHFGDQNLSGGVRRFRGDQDYQEMAQELSEAFDRADMSHVLRLLDKSFRELSFSLQSLFKDEQQKALEIIEQPALAEAKEAYDRIYQNRASFIRFLKAFYHPVPKPLQAAADFALNDALNQAIAAEPIDLDHISHLLEEVQRLNVTLDDVGLGYKLSQIIKRQAKVYNDDPANLEEMQQLDTLVQLARTVPFGVNLWAVQNMYYARLQKIYPEYEAQAAQGDRVAADWINQFRALGEKLSMNVPELKPAQPTEPPAELKPVTQPAS